MNELRLYTVEVGDPGNRFSLIKALKELSNFDNDFNGENGFEYLNKIVWEANGFNSYKEYKEAGKPELRYESNQDFYLSKIDEADEVSDKDIVNSFITDWLAHDSYYVDAKWECFFNGDDVTAIVLATMIN